MKTCVYCHSHIPPARPTICPIHAALIRILDHWGLSQPIHIWYVEKRLRRANIRISRPKIADLLTQTRAPYINSDGYYITPAGQIVPEPPITHTQSTQETHNV